ncbi:MAG: hypothetical protein II075_00565 [Bacteroidales bacterium]|nr:hypothetical protein [Bacteroidales bacterium]
MKKIFLRRSYRKIIAHLPIDKDDFFDKVCRALEGSGLQRVSDSEVAFDVKNRVLMVSYGVKINVHHRRVKYVFGSEGVVMAIIFMIFGGMLLFNGRFDTYMFWAAVFAGILFAINNALTISRIDGAIRSCLPKPEASPIVEPDPTCSITQQYICPACHSFLSGFGNSCPECGISLSYRQESVSNYKGYRFKYFFRGR